MITRFLDAVPAARRDPDRGRRAHRSRTGHHHRGRRAPVERLRRHRRRRRRQRPRHRLEPTDRPARLIVEYATTESFKDPRRIVGPAALETSDFTARVDLSGLPPGQRIFYRASFESLEDLGAERAADRHVRHAARCRASARRHRRLDRRRRRPGLGHQSGRWRASHLYDAMRKAEADVFLHCGDAISADQPLRR